MARSKAKRNRKQNVRHRDYVSTDAVVNAAAEPTTSGSGRAVPTDPSLDIVNRQAEGNTSGNNEGLATNTGMASMITNPNSMDNNVDSVITANEGDISAEQPVPGTPWGNEETVTQIPGINAGNNTLGKTAIDIALQNEIEIKKVYDEIKTLCTILGAMHNDFERTIATNQAGLFAVYGTLYGKQIDDIKHGYNLELEENMVIKNGITYAADIKAQMREPNYKNALMRHLNEVVNQTSRQVAAPATVTGANDTTTPPTTAESTVVAASAAAETNVVTATAAAAATTAAAAAAAAASASDQAAASAVTNVAAATPDQAADATVNVGWEEHIIDIMAENRKSNIIIKGILEISREDDQMEVEEMLDYLFCRHRINQIKNAGIFRLGGRRFDNEAAAN